MQQLVKTLCLVFAALLTACGADGNSDTSAPAPVTSTGHFIDAAVSGVAYTTSSGLAGTTGADGSFSFKPGDQVTFKVGGIVLGTATPTGTVTPVHFAPTGSNVSTPQVVSIVQFLMSVTDADAATGAMAVPASVASAAANQTIDFATATQSALSVLVNSVAPGKTLVSQAEAINHLSSSVYQTFVGTYKRTYSGAASGTWELTIDALGIVSGKTGDNSSIYGSMSTTLNTNGFAFTGTAASDTSWTGTLGGDGKFSGSWTNGDGDSGTFIGTKQ